MSATLGINRLKIESTGKTVNVPTDNYAKLMYYLNCVFTVIQYNNDTKLIDYQHYYNLNDNEKNIVLELAKLFDPIIFIKAKIFIYNPNISSNEFLKITDERVGVHVSEEIMIGGKAVKVLEIMVCNESWLSRNYYNPLKNIEKEKKYRGSSGQITIYQNSEAYTRKTTVNQTYPSSKSEFGNFSVNTYCFSCNKYVETETESHCSCCACCFCCFCLIGYICIQCMRGKNICPANVIHKCSICKTVLGYYDAC